MTDDDNFPFGNFPDRPDVPEFWHLCEIVLQMDGVIQEGGDRNEGFTRTVEEVIPLEVLAYMSRQRALRLLIPEDLPEDVQQLMAHTVDTAILSIVAAMYIDGFVAGYKYHERYAPTT